jgi:hypothetical protein
VKNAQAPNENPTAGPVKNSQPQPLTLAESFDWFETENTKFYSKLHYRDRQSEFNAERAIRSVSFLLNFLSAIDSGCPGGDDVEGYRAHGLALILQNVADEVRKASERVDLSELELEKVENGVVPVTRRNRRAT